MLKQHGNKVSGTVLHGHTDAPLSETFLCTLTPVHDKGVSDLLICRRSIEEIHLRPQKPAVIEASRAEKVYTTTVRKTFYKRDEGSPPPVVGEPVLGLYASREDESYDVFAGG